MMLIQTTLLCKFVSLRKYPDVCLMKQSADQSLCPLFVVVSASVQHQTANPNEFREIQAFCSRHPKHSCLYSFKWSAMLVQSASTNSLVEGPLPPRLGVLLGEIQ